MNSPVCTPVDDGRASSAPVKAPRIQILEAASGRARRLALDRRLRAGAPAGARIVIVSCNFDCEGPWAGVTGLFSAVLDEISSSRPDLLEQHAFELVQVLPSLQKVLPLPHASLTDLAPPEEKVRNYAADRAFRLVHGLIDLLDQWKTAVCPDTAWGIGCDDFDRAGAIGRRFFRELMRRRGERLGLHLIAAVTPDSGAEAREMFHDGAAVEIVSEDVPAECTAALSVPAAASAATELEAKVGEDYVAKQVHLADLIRLWRLAERPDKVLRWKWFATVLFLHRGLYEDALRYTHGLLPLAAAHSPNDERLRLWILIKTLNAYQGAQDTAGAWRFIDESVMRDIERPNSQEHVELLFLVAMMYARYKKPRDLVKGEEYLDWAIEVLNHIDLSPEDYHFEYAFNRNGVAMIRHFAGRFQDAIDLCRAGIDRLNANLGPASHRLHRSVLVYNIAQVYFAMGLLPEAIEHYTAVIALDPNYSEYYNERGNIFLRLGRLEEARVDYLEAIRLSPPYQEVNTNLGQCYRRMGRLGGAVDCYSRALDLEPGQTLALVGRAKALEELGRRDEAIADYSAALANDPGQWEALASRGVLYYEAGDLESCRKDFDRALELAPQQRDLYKNRSIVLADLGRPADAAVDIETALRLGPDREDCAELRDRLKLTLSAVS